MNEAPERVYLDGDVEAGDGMFPRCFENPKYASEPSVEYIRADRVTALLKAEREKALREAASLSWLCFHKCDVEIDVVTVDDILALIPEDATDG